MPEASQVAETPPRRVMRQWFQGLIAERMAQVAHLEANRQMLRRGARKMQNGTLGEPGEPVAEEDMQIRFGDEVHHHYEAPSLPSETPPPPLQKQAPAAGLLKKAALAGALLSAGTGAGLGISSLLSLLGDKPPAVEDTDTDTMPSVIVRPHEGRP